MKNIKKLGIWLDHSTADILDLHTASNNKTIESEFTYDVKVETLDKSESSMHNKKQQLQEAYYKKIVLEMLKYNHVLLFGPTNARVELQNYLDKDLHFKDIKIDVEATDKMTDNEKVAFVKEHFANK